MGDSWVAIDADPAHVQRERRKARELRQSQWWQAELARGICHYCGKHFAPEELTMDHVIPVARGGCSTRGNVVPACFDCNQKKKVMTPAEQILADLDAVDPVDDIELFEALQASECESAHHD